MQIPDPFVVVLVAVPLEERLQGAAEIPDAKRRTFRFAFSPLEEEMKLLRL
jgi:hypothetical protein